MTVLEIIERRSTERVVPVRRRRANGSLRPLQRVRFRTYHDAAGVPPGHHNPHSETEGELRAIEWQQTDGVWFPHSVVTTRATYDCYYCRRDERVYFYDAGSGVRDRHVLSGYVEPGPKPGRFWLAEGVRPLRWSGRRIDCYAPGYYVGVRRRGWQAMGYERIEGPVAHPLEYAEPARCRWCESCEDWIPDEDRCDHFLNCWWCSANYVSEGDEEQRCPDCERSQHECGACNNLGAEQCISCGEWRCDGCWPGHDDEVGDPCKRGRSDWKEPK